MRWFDLTNVNIGKMRVGGMRHTIEIQRRTTERNDYGELVETWEAIATVRAQVTVDSGAQVVQQDEVSNTQNIKVQIWGHVDVTERDRIIWRGGTYYIDMIPPSYDDRTKVLNCRRVNV
jgi:SPP1 family predicted phage head-tail adaptor